MLQHIGERKTIHSNNNRYETHLLGEKNINLYTKKVNTFFEKIRDIKILKILKT